MATAHDRQALFVCARIGGRVLALPVECVVETLRPLPIDGAGEGDGVVLGAARIRGERCPVIDAARMFGAPAHDGAARRFVVVRGVGVRVALLVDEVLAVRPADGERVGAIASTASDRVVDALRDVLARARWVADAARGEGVR